MKQQSKSVERRLAIQHEVAKNSKHEAAKDSKKELKRMGVTTCMSCGGELRRGSKGLCVRCVMTHAATI